MGMCPFEGEIGGGVIARRFASLSETTEKIMCIYIYIVSVECLLDLTISFN